MSNRLRSSPPSRAPSAPAPPSDRPRNDLMSPRQINLQFRPTSPTNVVPKPHSQESSWVRKAMTPNRAVTAPTKISAVDISSGWNLKPGNDEFLNGFQSVDTPNSPKRRDVNEMKKVVPTDPFSTLPRNDNAATLSSRIHLPMGTKVKSASKTTASQKEPIAKQADVVLQSRHRDSVTSKSTNFGVMTIEDLLEYFADVDSHEAGKKASFLHVTPRYNVENVKRENFYDLVLLEKPGYATSGIVWAKGIRTKDPNVLKPNQLMQLSLQGLLLSSDDDGAKSSVGVFIPLAEFLHERRIVEKLQSKLFFRCFREYRVFQAWYRCIRAKRSLKIKRILLSKTYFSHAPLVAVMPKISDFLYTLETDLELFAFHKPGAICIGDFLTAQIAKLGEMKADINDKILALGDIISNHYEVLISPEHLGKQLQDVKEHHPFAHLEEVDVAVDWNSLRALQRLRDDCKQKVENILWMTQYRVDTTIAHVLEKFWLRFKQLIKGVREVKQAAHRGHDGYWELSEAAENEMVPPCTAVDDGGTAVDTVADSKKKSLISVLKAFTRHDDKSIEESESESFTNPNDRFFVSPEWEKEGSHLSIDVTMCLKFAVATLDSFLLPENISRLKVRLLPMKKNLLEQMHLMIGELGKFIDSVPSLRQHPLVDPRRYKNPENYAEVEVEEGDANSSKYFAKMHLFPILNSANGLTHALESVQLVHDAHTAAADVEVRIVKMEDAFRRLCSLNPDGITKPLNLSLVLPKHRELMEDPTTVEETERTLARDRGRLTSLLKAIDHIENTRVLKDYFLDIKKVGGFITSFTPSNTQLDAFRDIQYLRLFSKVPAAFSTRCKKFIDYMIILESHFELRDTNLDGLIKLMKSLKYFEKAKQLFNMEAEVIETLYRLLQDHPTSGVTADQLPSLSNMVNSKKTQTSIVATKPESLMKQYQDGMGRIMAALTRGKSLLLGQLIQIKRDALSHRQGLHDRISLEMETLQKPIYSSSNSNAKAEIILSSLRKSGERLEKIKSSVKEIMETQHVLLEAHDIIGSANILLSPSEVDHFVDLPDLEKLFTNRFNAWHSVAEIEEIRKKILTARLLDCNVKNLQRQQAEIKKSFEYLLSHLEETGIMTRLLGMVDDIKPKIEVISYLSSKCLKPRHWLWMGDHVFSHCGYSIRLQGADGEIVSIIDTRENDTSPLGTNILRLPVNNLLTRKIEDHVEKIRFITSEAVIESMIEVTLDQIDETVKSINVATSMKWLKDVRLREKIFFELNEAVNLIQLRVVLQYCQKTASVLEQTSLDMNITTFNTRLDRTREILQRLERFVFNLAEIQYKWMFVFCFVKFSSPGELDRDTTRTYQSCTEDLKRIESALQQKNGNLLLAANSIPEYEVTSENTKLNLNYIMEHAHCNIQSLLDAYPRLSLLSYSKMNLLVKAWTLGPHHQFDLINECMHDLFDGIGHLLVMNHVSKRAFYCAGFSSSDVVESVQFDEEILFAQPIVDFLIAFEEKLRSSLTKSTDFLFLERVQALRYLLNDVSVQTFLQNMVSVLLQRSSVIVAQAKDTIPNQVCLLSNHSYFVEDIWTCLGHPSGALEFAKQDIAVSGASLSGMWRANLENMIFVCKDNIKAMQEVFQLHDLSKFKLRGQKALALASALFLQEISFLRTTEELLECKCLESATEMWASRYQMRFVYNKGQRYRGCPFDVSIGCITIPYGLEYQGAHLRVMLDLKTECALQSVLSTAMCQRGSVFVTPETNLYTHDSNGECALSCKDIALLLGRLCTPLLSVESNQSLRLFFSRCCYLDAVGCMDFTTVDHASMQLIISSLNSFWKAAEERNDVFLQDGLKFPLKTAQRNTDAQVARRKENLALYRDQVNFLTKTRKEVGLIVIGLASDHTFSSVSVFEYFSRSIFNITTVECYKPVSDLGLLLATKGFSYGMEIQTTFEAILSTIKLKYESCRYLAESMCSSLFLQHVVSKASIAVLLWSKWHAVGLRSSERLVAEFDAFSAVLWENILALKMNDHVNPVTLYQEIIAGFQGKLTKTVTPEKADSVALKQKPELEHFHIPFSVDSKINTTNKDLCRLSSPCFNASCAKMWTVLTNSIDQHVILSGGIASGKSSVRDTVIELIRRHGSFPVSTTAGQGIIKFVRMAKVIKQCISHWMSVRKHHKDSHGHHHRTLHHDDVEENHHQPINESQRGQRSAGAHSAVGHKHKEKGFHHVCAVGVSVIYHSSLTPAAFLGAFDNQNRWNDGILLRKIRSIESTWEVSHKRGDHGEVTSKDWVSKSLHVIVLDGPLGYYAEQIFCASNFLSSRLCTFRSFHATSNRRLVLPSGEMYTLPPFLRFVFETDDISHSSPAFTAYAPHVKVAVDGRLCWLRLTKMWIRSVTGWLGHFLPWVSIIRELSTLLIGGAFIPDLLFHDKSESELSPVMIVSRMTSFYRYLEEMLSLCHSMAIADATFVPHVLDEGDDESSGSEDEIEDEISRQLEGEDDAGAIDVVGLTMTMSDKSKEMLRLRVHHSIAYAAIWGFGGSANASNKERKFFDALCKDVCYNYFRGDVEFEDGGSVFDHTVDMNTCAMKMPVHPKFHKTDILKHIPQKYKACAVMPEIDQDSEFNIRGVHDRLVFRTPGMTSVGTAIEMLLESGGNVLLIGKQGVGKTKLMCEVLHKLSSNMPSSAQMRAHIHDNLIDLLSEKHQTKGVPAVLAKLRGILNQLEHVQPTSDDETSLFEQWAAIQRESETTSKRKGTKTMYPSTTTLRGCATADVLKDFLSREFCTEVPNLLESVGMHYGVVFIDDLHVLSDSGTAYENRMAANRPEALLKGILEATPPFGIKVDNRISSTKYRGRADGHMLRADDGKAVVHRSILTDPRITSSDDQDNYIMARVGIASAATVDSVGALCQSKRTQHGLSRFAVIGLGEMDSNQLHAALIGGSFLCLHEGSPNNDLVKILQTEVIDMCSVTLVLCDRMISSADSVLTTPLEKAARSVVDMNINLVARFCASLRLGSSKVSDPGALMQLFAHEWKRYFLDPLPDGAQRERYVALLRSELEQLDATRWYVSAAWMESLISRMGAHDDEVWVDSSVLSQHSIPGRESDAGSAAIVDYRYIPFIIKSVDSCDSSSEDGRRTFESKGDFHTTSCLYPSAMRMVMRLIRILKSVGNHVLLSGFMGTTRLKALHLAATFCEYKFCSFDVKDSFEIADSGQSDRAAMSFQFKRFLKSCLLRMAGFRNVRGDLEDSLFNPFHQVYSVTYKSVPPEKVLVCVTNGQCLSLQDRRDLMLLVDYEDPTGIFESFEITAMADVLRRMAAGEGDSKFARGDINDSLDDKKSTSSPSKSNGTNGRSTKTTLDNGDAVEGEDIGANGNEEVGSSTKQIRAHYLLTAYAFQIVKRHFQQMMAKGLSVAIDTEVTRSMTLAPNNTTSTASKDKGNNEDNVKVKIKQNSSDMLQPKFSLLSAKPVHQTITSESEKQLSYTNQIFGGGPTRPVIGVFNCALLGPLVTRRFNTLWWDIEATDAAHGVCDVMFRSFISTHHGLLTHKPSSGIRIEFVPSTVGQYIEMEMMDSTELALSRMPNDHIREDKRVSQSLTAQSPSPPASISISISPQDNPLIGFISTVHELGIFSSTAESARDLTLSFHPQSGESFLSAMLDEARVVLPHILSLSAPCDALFLNEPVAVPGPEKVAELASEVVCALLSSASKTLFHRYLMIQTVHTGLLEAENVMHSIPAKTTTFTENNRAIASASRQFQKERGELKHEIDNLKKVFSKLPEAEQVSMLREEILSIEFETIQARKMADDALMQHKRKLNSISQVEWFALSAIYAAKPPKEYVDVMRSIIIVTQYVPTKVQRGKPSATGRLDDEAIARCAVAMLRSPEFGSQVGNSKSSQLTQSSLDALRLMNKILRNSTFGVDITYELPLTLDRATNAETTATNPILETLKRFALMIEVHANINAKNDLQHQHAKELMEREKALEEINTANLNIQNHSLTEQLDIKAQQMQELDNDTVKNRGRLEALKKLKEHHDTILKAVEDAIFRANTELEMLRRMLECIVCDSCIVAATLMRAGWLPEDLRQQCMMKFRQTLIDHGLKVTETPFVLGSMYDRLQTRMWTPSGVESLPRDPASINAMQLVFICPNHSFVIDPDGVADVPLTEACPEGCTLCITTALRFTLTQLEQWSANAKESNGGNAALYIVVTDSQAGVSDDLITFLSADLSVRPKVGDADSSDEEKCGELELVANLNPVDDSHPLASATLTLCRLRVIVVSTKPPSVDSSNGCCKPLPGSCFKNMTTIHWATSIQPSFVVESKPIEAAMNQRDVSSQILLQRLTRTFCHRICATHVSFYQEVQSTLIEKLLEWNRLEDTEVVMLYRWLVDERADTLRPFIIPGFIHHDAVPLGFVAQEKIFRELLSNALYRKPLLQDIRNLLSLEREICAFESTVGESFSMAIDFMRFCGRLIPVQLFPPHALAPRAIASKCVSESVEGCIDSAVFQFVPQSMKAMNRFSLTMKQMQQQYRKRKQQKTDRAAASAFEDADRITGTTELFNGSQRLLLAKVVRTWESKSPKDQEGVASGDVKARHFGVGMGGRDRRRCQQELVFLMSPLRSLFLKEAVQYLLSTIRPGHEWIVKFSLLVTTWCQSHALSPNIHESIPMDEIRTLVQFVNLSVCKQQPRYAHFVILKRPVDGLKDAKTEFLDAFPPILTAADVTATERNAASSTMTFGSQESVESSTTNSKLTAGEAENESEQEVMRPPSSMRRRQTAFRAFVPRPVYVDATEEDDLVASKRQRKEGHSDKRVEDRLNDWRIVHSFGFGPLDGLMLNTSSRSWILHSESKRGKSEVSASQAISRVSVACCDGVVMEIAPRRDRDVFSQARTDNRDPFEVEWLQASEIRLFAPAGIVAATELGASEKVVSAIAAAITSRRVQNASTPRLSNNFFAPSRPSKAPPTGSRPSAAGGGRNIRTHSRKTSKADNQSVKAGDRRVSSRSSHRHQGSIAETRRTKVGNTQSRDMRNQSIRVGTPIATPRTSVASENSSASLSRRMSQSGTLAAAAAAKLNAMVAGLGSTKTALIGDVGGAKKRKSTLKDTTSKLIAGLKDIRQLTHRGESLQVHAGESAAHSMRKAEDLATVFSTPSSKYNLRMLEEHSALSKVFGGCSRSIHENLEEFMEWKEVTDELRDLNFGSMCESELVDAIDQIIPPNFEPPPAHGIKDLRQAALQALKGAWAHGHELSVIQTMLLMEAVRPGSAGTIANLLFALVVSMLKVGGKLVVHSDEVAVEIEDKVTMKGIVEKEERDSESDEGDDTFGNDGYSDSDDSFGSGRGTKLKGKLQQGLFFTNCWSRFKDGLQGHTHFPSTRLQFPHTRTQLKCRDLEDWDAALLDVLGKGISGEKYAFTLQLRTSMRSDCNSAVFLCSPDASAQHLTILSQRARDMFTRVEEPFVDVLNCNDLSIESCGLDAKQQRVHMTDVFKIVKHSVHVGLSRKAIVEELDLQSRAGNSILNCILPPVAQIGSQFGASFNSNFEKDLSTPTSMSTVVNGDVGNGLISNARARLTAQNSLLPVAALQSKLSRSVRKGPEGDAAVVKAAPGRQFNHNFPLLVTASWGIMHVGRGTTLSISELNFSWLPRFLVPDIIGAGDVASQAFTYYTDCLHPSVVESGGILSEEMENSLLWVMVCLRRFSKANVTENMINRLRWSSKSQVRMVSCLVVIWRLVQYQHCAQDEINEVKGGSWSWAGCLVPLSLWQISRLLLKAADISEAKWVAILDTNTHRLRVADLLNSEEFSKAVCLLTETFYSFRYDKSRKEQLDSVDGDSDSSLSPGRQPNALKRGAQIHISGGVEASASRGGSRQAAMQHMAHVKTQQMSEAALAHMNRRMKKKAAKKAAMEMKERLEKLASVDRFGLEAAARAAGARRDTAAKVRAAVAAREAAAAAAAAASATATPGGPSKEAMETYPGDEAAAAIEDSKHRQFRDRLLSFVARFLSELIVAQTKSAKWEDSEQYINLGSKFTARRSSIKMDIKNFLQDISKEKVKQNSAASPAGAQKHEHKHEHEQGQQYPLDGEFVTWPDIFPDNCDVWVGGLCPSDVVQYMVRWTLDRAAVEGFEDITSKQLQHRKASLGEVSVGQGRPYTVVRRIVRRTLLREARKRIEERHRQAVEQTHIE